MSPAEIEARMNAASDPMEKKLWGEFLRFKRNWRLRTAIKILGEYQ